MRRHDTVRCRHKVTPSGTFARGTSEQVMTRHLAPALSDVRVAALRHSRLLRARRAVNANSAITNCPAQTHSEIPRPLTACLDARRDNGLAVRRRCTTQANAGISRAVVPGNGTGAASTSNPVPSSVMASMR